MDRRTFLASAVVSLSSLVGSHVIARQQQRQVDKQQDQTTTSLLADQKSLAKEQVNISRELDSMDLDSITAMQGVLLRTTCDTFAALLGIPYTNVAQMLIVAQRVVASGADPLNAGFWDRVVEEYINEHSEPESESHGVKFINALRDAKVYSRLRK